MADDFDSALKAEFDRIAESAVQSLKSDRAASFSLTHDGTVILTIEAEPNIVFTANLVSLVSEVIEVFLDRGTRRPAYDWCPDLSGLGRLFEDQAKRIKSAATPP